VLHEASLWLPWFSSTFSGQGQAKTRPSTGSRGSPQRLTMPSMPSMPSSCAGNGCKLTERMWPPELFATSPMKRRNLLGSEVVAAGAIAQRHAENQCWTCAQLGSKWFLSSEKVVLYAGHFVHSAAWYSFFFVFQFGYCTLTPLWKNHCKTHQANLMVES
jgi:hypothetical protein